MKRIILLTIFSIVVQGIFFQKIIKATTPQLVPLIYIDISSDLNLDIEKNLAIEAFIVDDEYSPVQQTIKIVNSSESTPIYLLKEINDYTYIGNAEVFDFEDSKYIFNASIAPNLIELYDLNTLNDTYTWRKLSEKANNSNEEFGFVINDRIYSPVILNTNYALNKPDSLKVPESESTFILAKINEEFIKIPIEINYYENQNFDELRKEALDSDNNFFTFAVIMTTISLIIFYVLPPLLVVIVIAFIVKVILRRTIYSKKTK